MTTRRPLTITAVAAGIGTAAALALGPMASAATTQASTRDVQKAAAHNGTTGSTDQLADTGVDTTPYALGGAGFLVAGVGMIFVSRRFAG
ncbi:LPXTG cell wall anchor domain-containing protein [Streptacidiphilus carbonis]|uniref:LPXTG cell wall anchor domain-containing protein n=1 Tax=Streptacidiphilus carbonis TaxID=105422 RepID=UPI0005A805D6|nr:LPXTG cell wall anchor domain-containing protein [Streptacidiphilus carbonis]